jgi:hypothetical protein
MTEEESAWLSIYQNKVLFLEDEKTCWDRLDNNGSAISRPERIPKARLGRKNTIEEGFCLAADYKEHCTTKGTRPGGPQFISEDGTAEEQEVAALIRQGILWRNEGDREDIGMNCLPAPEIGYAVRYVSKGRRRPNKRGSGRCGEVGGVSDALFASDYGMFGDEDWESVFSGWDRLSSVDGVDGASVTDSWGSLDRGSQS